MSEMAEHVNASLLTDHSRACAHASTAAAQAGHPNLSVVIATLKRSQLLSRCLGALLDQTLPLSAYEVIVVDDGPDEATEAVITEWRRQNPQFAVRYCRSASMHGPAAARNVGWRAAQAPVIAFTDDDCIPDRGWLAAGVRGFSRQEVGGVWGRIQVPLSARPTDWERNVAGLEQAPCATANCFYRRTVLQAVGGFDERFTEAWREDSDVQFGALARGVTILHEPQALVTHPVRPAPWGISIRLQRQNRFNALLYKKHPQLYYQFNPHEPPWAYYGSVGLLLIAVIAAAGGALWAAALLLGAWMFIAAAFCLRRLRGASHRPVHVIEMMVTSALIPPYAVFWRLYGALIYRVAFF
ncbi:MAG TPA: glycosyltransferase [Nitrospira sp.]|nr:glycosyltransferase [Nitrospira sp.]